MSFIGFILALSILVFVHEYGHYYFARRAGIYVQEFSIGFGKELVSFIDKNNTKWKICLIPLGGFVKLYGDVHKQDSASAKLDPTKAFFTKSLLQRFLVVAGGPLFNYIFAIIILTGLFVNFGKAQVPAIVSNIAQNSPAEKSGLAVGDIIIKINDKALEDFTALRKMLVLNQNAQVILSVNRNGEILELPVTLSEQSLSQGDKYKVKTGYLGITVENRPEYIKLGLIQSLVEAAGEAYEVSVITLKMLSQIITGNRSVSEIGGPLLIAKESGKSLSGGVANFLLFIAMLSINLGLINLIPIPILDGGHLLFIVYEMIARRPLNIRTQNFLLKIGTGIIVFLIVISMSNDIKNLIF